MSDEQPKLKPQEKIFSFCPFCGAEYDSKLDGNVDIKCPECDVSFKVRKL